MAEVSYIGASHVRLHRDLVAGKINGQISLLLTRPTQGPLVVPLEAFRAFLVTAKAGGFDSLVD